MDFLYKISTLCDIMLGKIGLNFTRLSHKETVHKFVYRFADDIQNSFREYSSKKDNYTIWVFWAQGKSKMPNVVRNCYESILRNKGDFSVVLLDESNYSDYVCIPEHVCKKMQQGLITMTHFSDILRFALLKTYGGFWLDATIYVTSTIEMPSTLFTIRQKGCSDYISSNRWCGFLWYAPQGHPLASFCYSFLCEYWRKYNELVDYFLIDYIIEYFYNSSSAFKREIDELPCSNRYLYFFQSVNCEALYDDVIWHKMCQETQFFKTTWKKIYKKKENGCETYYGEILGHGIDNNTGI